MMRFASLALFVFAGGTASAQSLLPSGGSDNCVTAAPIAGFGTFLGDNIGATSDFIPICVPHFGADVWYDWTAPASGAVYITLCNPGTAFDSKLAVFDTSACVGSMLACNDDHDPGMGIDCSTVAFDATAGNVYKIFVSSGLGAASTYEMTISAAFTSFCHPGTGGVLACPCGNPPSGPGRGCNNFGASSGGAILAASGIPTLFPDMVYLTATAENATALNVFFTGSALTGPSGVFNGAGVRCVTSLKRLYTGNASGGMIIRPSGPSPSVSARSAAVGAPIAPGDTRYYFNVYRDPNAAGPCGSTTSTVNLTNAVSVHWAP